MKNNLWTLIKDVSAAWLIALAVVVFGAFLISCDETNLDPGCDITKKECRCGVYDKNKGLAKALNLDIKGCDKEGPKPDPDPKPEPDKMACVERHSPPSENLVMIFTDEICSSAMNVHYPNFIRPISVSPKYKLFSPSYGSLTWKMTGFKFNANKNMPVALIGLFQGRFEDGLIRNMQIGPYTKKGKGIFLFGTHTWRKLTAAEEKLKKETGKKIKIKPKLLRKDIQFALKDDVDYEFRLDWVPVRGGTELRMRIAGGGEIAFGKHRWPSVMVKTNLQGLMFGNRVYKKSIGKNGAVTKARLTLWEVKK